MPGRDRSVMADGLFLFYFLRGAMKEKGRGKWKSRPLTVDCIHCYGVIQVFLK